ncbi:MAG TPA: hypothetical protein VJH21_01630 [Candidatus Paceibacterota bacterium]
MIGEWVSFAVVIIVQSIFFACIALYYKKIMLIPKILLFGIIIGTVIGLLHDSLLGKYFGLFSYTLGSEVIFLLLNAPLSYGLFVATTLLVQKVSITHFVIWLSILIFVYEITNIFFPVWSYNFSLPLLPFFILCLAGYSSGALLASFIAQLIFKQPFVLEIKS